MIQIFELLIILSFAIALLYLIKIPHLPALTVVICATVTITLGEIYNSQITRVTIYNSEYLLWMPQKSFPVCIIPAGILLTLVIYFTAVSVLDIIKLNTKFSIVFSLFILLLLCTIMPFFEKLCVTLGLWRWQHPDNLTFIWYIGVYKYYLLHLLLAVYPGLVLKEYKKVTVLRD